MDPVDATGRGVATDAGPMALAALVALPGTGVAAEGGVAAESFQKSSVSPRSSRSSGGNEVSTSSTFISFWLGSRLDFCRFFGSSGSTGSWMASVRALMASSNV